MTKTLNKTVIEGKYLNIIMAVCERSIATIIHNNERLKTFFSKIRNDTRISTFLISIQHNTNILVRTNRQEKEIKSLELEKKSKMISVSINMILYVESIRIHKILLELIKKGDKLLDSKLIHKNQLYFYTLTMYY